MEWSTEERRQLYKKEIFRRKTNVIFLWSPKTQKTHIPTNGENLPTKLTSSAALYFRSFFSFSTSATGLATFRNDNNAGLWKVGNRAVASILSQRLLQKWRIQGQFSWLVFTLDTFRYVRWMHFSQHKLCTIGKWSLHSRWNFITTFTKLHVHGDERWPTEVTSDTCFRGALKDARKTPRWKATH